MEGRAIHAVLVIINTLNVNVICNCHYILYCLYVYPTHFSACNCDSQGTIGLTCNEDGVCNCEHNFDGEKCNKCKDGFYNFPVCEGFVLIVK